MLPESPLQPKGDWVCALVLYLQTPKKGAGQGRAQRQPGWLWESTARSSHTYSLCHSRKAANREASSEQTQQHSLWGSQGQIGRMRGTNLSWKARERAALSTASLSWRQLQIQSRSIVLQKSPERASQTLGFVWVAIKPILLTNFVYMENNQIQCSSPSKNLAFF